MHYFLHFKGFKSSTINLFSPFTLLIGPNGSGKSNVIEGIELLSFIAHGRPLHEIADIGKGGGKSLEIRGGLQSCPQYGNEMFGLGFSASMKWEGIKRVFNYYVFVLVAPQPQIAAESLEFDNGPMVFKTVPREPPFSASGDIMVEYNNFARGGHKPKVPVSANRSVISQYKEFASKNKKSGACARLVDGIMKYLRSSFVFDPNPKLMRSYERIGNSILSRDGANISAVLYALSQGNEEKKASLDRLLDWIKQLPEEPYENFEFVTTPLNDVIFGLREANGGQLVDARLLSDGTLRCLAVLTALETVDPNSRVIIEEFDNGLHPSRTHILTEALDSCCKKRELNVLVTTHNPATLNGLQMDQLNGVVLCARNIEDQSLHLIRLQDLPHFNELLERGRLGDLVTRRIVDQYLIPRFEEKQKEKALTWLQNLP